MQIESYLFFSGNCEEALAFYERCLGGKTVTKMRYEGSPMDNGQLPAAWKQKVMHATFEAEGARFMASDSLPGQPAAQFAGFSMSLHTGQDAARARAMFDALANGGTVTMPLAPPFWGGQFGMLKDKFGVPWMVSCDA